tara:strand:- start:49 stop:231 length:183 start_codon:yes stop_codon:yes gene_type:complete
VTEAELYGRAKQLHETAHGPQTALLPKAAKTAIREAATLVLELATREAKRCREQKTTEKQ